MADPAQQAELFDGLPANTRAAVSAFLNDGARRPVRVVVNRNRVSMLSVAFQPDDSITVRMNHRLLQAPQPVLLALRNYLRTRRRASWRVAADHASGLPPEPERAAPPPRPRGDTYDLAELLRGVNRRFFNGRLRCGITWGPAPRRPRRRRRASRRSIRFASYDPDRRLIRVHPLLDDARVPRRFLEYIVFHELLHAAVPADRTGGQCRYHHAFFRQQERRFPGWHEMQRLGRSLLETLG